MACSPPPSLSSTWKQRGSETSGHNPIPTQPTCDHGQTPPEHALPDIKPVPRKPLGLHLRFWLVFRGRWFTSLKLKSSPKRPLAIPGTPEQPKRQDKHRDVPSTHHMLKHRDTRRQHRPSREEKAQVPQRLHSKAGPDQASSWPFPGLCPRE